MNHLIRDAFLEPALSLLATLDHHREGLDFSDAEFLTLGVRRINTFHPSGRSFLQSARQCDVTEVSLKAYFGAASSLRRLSMVHELNTKLSRTIVSPTDRFARFPELAGRDVLALDGHDVRHATHEPPATMASGRREVPDTVTGVFLRNLRSGAARVLTQTDGHQHEWAAVKARPWSDFLWHPDAKGTTGCRTGSAPDRQLIRNQEPRLVGGEVILGENSSGRFHTPAELHRQGAVVKAVGSAFGDGMERSRQGARTADLSGRERCSAFV